jgi:signal transduction histidine kinase
VTHFKKLEKVKDEFIATASHDLRNPITSIKGYSQLMQHAGPLNENQTEFVQRIQHAAEHMGELVENMLDLAKMDLGAEPKTEILDMTHLLWQIADEFQPHAEAKRQLLTLEKTETSSRVRGDALQLRQALRNLIGNAIKYTPDGGNVTVNGRFIDEATQPEIEITVRDTGIGIDPQNQQLVFEKFYQTGEVLLHSSGKTKFKGGGPGLGLAIARGIVNAHHGRIWLESPGHDETTNPGTTVFVRLPLNGLNHEGS